MLTRAIVDELKTIEEPKPTVVSMYLDIDGRSHVTRDEVEKAAGVLIRRAQKEVDEYYDLSHEDQRSVTTDLERIQDWVRLSLKRDGAKAVAIFACQGRGLFEIVSLPRPVPSDIHVDRRAHLAGLMRLLDCADSHCVLLVNKESARIFKYCMGSLTEESRIFDEVPNRHHQGGWAQMRFQRHIDDHVHRHIRHVADATLRYFKQERFDKLILSATEEIWPELERTLHSYLRRRIVARPLLDVGAPAGKVAEVVAEIETAEEKKHEEELVSRLQEEIDAGGPAVEGVDKILTPLREARVGTLLIRDTASPIGLRCPNDGYLSLDELRCPRCGSDMEPGVDLVEGMVEEALAQGCEVHFISSNVPSWAVSEAGAFLRY